MGAGQRVGYIRVSSVGQSTARQLKVASKDAKDAKDAKDKDAKDEPQLTNVELDRTFTDKVSAKDTNRPGLREMLAYVREGDTVLVHSIDRLARNLTDLRNLVTELTGKGIAVEFVKQGLRFTGEDSAMNNLLLNMLGAVAEFERAIIRERQLEGIAIAKAKGDVYKGRKPRLSADQARELAERAGKGESKAALAKSFGITRQTVYSYLATI